LFGFSLTAVLGSPRRADATYDVENYQGPATPTKNAILKYLNFRHISVFKF
jgi:hypothetical protein